MSSYKRIRNSDKFVLPYVANKQWSFDSSSLDDNGIFVYRGIRDNTVFKPDTDDTTYNAYQKLIFHSVNHLFYQEFSGSFINNTSSLQSNFYDSSSIYFASESYYDYRKWNDQSKYFPTGSNEAVTVFSIPRNIFSSGVKKGSFIISSSNYFIVDDAKGNLVDVFNSIGDFNNDYNDDFFIGGDIDNIVIGNIFYSHGLAIITHQDYQSVF